MQTMIKTQIDNRINKLIKSDIIIGFNIVIDYSKLDFRPYKINILLSDIEKIDEIIEFVENNPHLIEINKTIGYRDLELVFVLKDVSQIHHIMDDLSNQFKYTIKNYTYISIIESHKWSYFREK